MFKTEAILIHSHKIRDHSTRYIFLTKQYGKISCFYKKNEGIGSPGDILDILIERKDGINLLKQSDIRTSLYFRNPDYLFIISFLQILKIFYECIGESDIHESLFQDYKDFIHHIVAIRQERIQDSLLFQIRILKKLGFMDGTDFQSGNMILKYIYKHIDEKKLSVILEGKTLDKEFLYFFEANIQKSMYQSIS